MKAKKRGYWNKSRYISLSNTGYWTKYGGGRYTSDREELKTWHCQSCGEKQLDLFPSYVIGIGSVESVRVCVFCRYISIIKNVNSYEDLLVFVRKPDMLALIANLATLPIRF